MLPTKLTSAARFGSLVGAASAVDGACSDVVDVRLMRIPPLCDGGPRLASGRPAPRVPAFAFDCRVPGFRFIMYELVRLRKATSKICRIGRNLPSPSR